MSESLILAETEQESFCDVFLPSAALSTNALCGIVAEDHLLIDGLPRRIKKEGVFLSGPKPPPPPLLSSQLPLSSPRHVRPRLAHPRHVLVVDKEGVVPQDTTPRTISPVSVLSSSSLSPFAKNVAEDHQLSSPYMYDIHEYAPMYESPYNLSQSNAKSLSSSEHSANYATSIAESTDLDFDYSHLICSHNIDDFGDDIAYGQPETSPYASVQEVPFRSPAEPDFSFIDNIYESVRAEIEAEKAVSSPSRATPEAPSTPPVITLGVGSPVTIVSADGKEYKVVLQEVKHEPKTGSKRKSSTSVTESAPKPKRAPGIPLANLSIEEINARKREQNRIAAQRYREKKKNSKETGKEEEERLEKRNSFLRVEAVRLQQEIDELRKAILGAAAPR